MHRLTPTMLALDGSVRHTVTEDCRWSWKQGEKVAWDVEQCGPGAHSLPALAGSVTDPVHFIRMKGIHYFWHIWICRPRFYLSLLRPRSKLISVAPER